VLFGGDYMNGDYSEIIDAQKYAEILSKIKSKNEKYGVFGNHDFEDLTFLGFRKYKINLDKYSKKLEGFLKKAEIKMLKDEKVLINDDVYLVGREDEMLNKENGHSRKSASILIPKTKKPIIVLEHEPFEFRDISKNGANLILAGHTHAGQIWPGAIASRLSNDMNYGIKKKGSCTAIVSSGVGFWGPAMRLFTKSEYVVINFEY
jgi:predicted MPP superfamily phosphohydrolase